MKLKRWQRRAVKGVGWSVLALLLVVWVVIGGVLYWLAHAYSRERPLDLTPYLPRVERYLAERGVNVSLGRVEVFYEGAPVVRAAEIALLGQDGEVSVFVEQAAIKLANRRLLLLQLSPKFIEAKGVTLRLVRGTGGVSLAGWRGQVEEGEERQGFISWLNGLRMSAAWGRLKDVRVDKVNLLLRDEVEQAEWVLENGRLLFTRYEDDGERGTLTANVRRIYGQGGPRLLRGQVMPVLVSFDHQTGAREAYLAAKFDHTDMRMAEGYLPPQLQDLLKARGSVEVGLVLMPGNALGQPWLTLRLADVRLQLPKGYSQPLVFPRLTLTASYRPSPTDVLEIKSLVAAGKRGNVWQAEGKVENVTGDALVDMSIRSDGGDVQGVFDLFPDQPRGFNKALKWLRPNIRDATYNNLRAQVAVRPSVFPHCEDACGRIEILAGVDGGEVTFLPEVAPARITSATFVWQGQQFSVLAPEAKIGDQEARNVNVTLIKLFSADPTHVLVSGTLTGGLGGMMGELAKLDDEGRVPAKAEGRHTTTMSIEVPLPRGREATFAESTVIARSTVDNVKIGGMKELGEQVFAAERAQVTLDASKELRVVADGSLGGNRLSVDWRQSIQPGGGTPMAIRLDGFVGGDWLMQQAGRPGGVSVTGVVKVNGDVTKTAKGEWGFAVNAAAADAVVDVARLAFHKPKGKALDVTARGTAGTKGVNLSELKVSGAAEARGTLRWSRDKPDDTVLRLNPLRAGRTDVAVDYANRAMKVTGNSLDISGLELFDAKDSSDELIRNALLTLNVKEVVNKDGTLQNVSGQMRARNGRWDVERLVSTFAGGRISVQETARHGDARTLMVNVENVGKALQLLGVYQHLRGGKLWGDIVYSNPTTAKGQLKLEHFELDNPTVLMRLLSLLSLEQLVAGTDTIIFSRATVPLRLEGSQVYLDNAVFEGPSMTIRLNGAYMRESEELNFDGNLAPAIPLNRLVAKIPLIGTILTGSQDGVVVADFKLKGPASEPQINVRPLSVLTPGLVKDVFRGVTGGGAPKGGE